MEVKYGAVQRMWPQWIIWWQNRLSSGEYGSEEESAWENGEVNNTAAVEMRCQIFQ